MDEVKQLVARTFADLGAKDVFNLRDTLFLENGRCLAVAYRADGLRAIWCCTGSNHRVPQRRGKSMKDPVPARRTKVFVGGSVGRLFIAVVFAGVPHPLH